MRNKKVVLRNFRYCDCDAMALFLEKMAVKGWHFASWRVGMVFERGEPRRESYAVEVFPNGSEMDLKPSEDAQEYAQYCREAGWELVDSRRKFCIFRRIKEDAAPIWDARKALMGQSGVKTYSVFYEDKMMVLWGTSLDLDEAQIQKIRQKLELH